jgi:hypothetical protein
MGSHLRFWIVRQKKGQVLHVRDCVTVIENVCSVRHTRRPQMNTKSLRNWPSSSTVIHHYGICVANFSLLFFSALEAKPEHTAPKSVD